MTTPRPTRALAIAAGLTVLAVMTGCGSSPPKSSAACRTAAKAARYIESGNGDIGNDQMAAYALHAAHWTTPAQRRYAAALSVGLDTTGTLTPENAITLVPDANHLLRACKVGTQH